MNERPEEAYGQKQNNGNVQNVSLITLGTNGGLALLKGSFGVAFGSAALTADAFHSVSDILSSGIVFWGLKFSRKPADVSHHYGHDKLESVASKLVAIILILTAMFLGYNAIELLYGPVRIPGAWAIAAAVISVLVKELLFHYNKRKGEYYNSSALKADAWHNRSDALSSIAALIGIIGARLGYPFFDPLGALLVSALILKVGVNIYLGSIKELIDTAPGEDLIEQVKQTVRETEGILSVREIKARYHGPGIFIDMKVCVDKNHTVAQGHHYAGAAKHRVLKEMPEVKNVLIHVNPCHPGETNRCYDCIHKEGETNYEKSTNFKKGE